MRSSRSATSSKPQRPRRCSAGSAGSEATAAAPEEHSDRAFALVEGLPLSEGTARIYAQRARNTFISGDPTGGLDHSREALPLTIEVGSDELESHVLTTLGMCRVALGDAGGIDDLNRAVELADATNLPESIVLACNNLANMLWRLGRLDEAAAPLTHAREVAERFGVTSNLRWLLGEDMLDHALRGEWDETLELADEIVEQAAEAPHYHEAPARTMRSEIYLGRDDLAAALSDSERAVELALEAKDLQLVGPALLTRARVLVGAGRQAEADTLILELLHDHDLPDAWMHGLGLLLVQLGRGDEYLAAIAAHATNAWLDATRAAAEGDLRRSAALFGQIGARAAEAEARLLAAEALAAEGRGAEAEAELAPAVAYYASVRATAFLRRADALSGRLGRGGLARMTNLWHGFADMGAVDGHEFVVARGDGCYVWDEAGRRYLDGTASLWYANVGYGRREIADAVAAQLADAARVPHLRRIRDAAGARPRRPAGRDRAGRRQQGLPHARAAPTRSTPPRSSRAATSTSSASPSARSILTRSWAYHGMHAYGTAMAGIEANRSRRRARRRHRARPVGLGRRARRDDRPHRRRAASPRSSASRWSAPAASASRPRAIFARARDRPRRRRALRLRRGDHRVRPRRRLVRLDALRARSRPASRSRRASRRGTCRSAASWRRRTSPSRSGAAHQARR